MEKKELRTYLEDTARRLCWRVDTLRNNGSQLLVDYCSYAHQCVFDLIDEVDKDELKTISDCLVCFEQLREKAFSNYHNFANDRFFMGRPTVIADLALVRYFVIGQIINDVESLVKAEMVDL